MKSKLWIYWLKRTSMFIGAGISVLLLWFWFILSQVPSALQPDSSRPVGVLFENVHVLSMVDDNPIPQRAQAVLVIGEHIAEIGDSGLLQTPEGVLVVDGQGGTLMPGLIDAHIHLHDERELAAYLAHGVTGLRNMSGFPFHLRLNARVENGQLLAPDFITTGTLLNSRGPNENVLQRTVTTAEEARRVVRAQHNAGYRHLKVYSNLTADAFDAILDEATRLRMTVSGHSPEGVRTAGVPRTKPFEIPWERSLGQGFTTLEHIETIVWHSLRDQIDEAGMREVARVLAESGEAVTPTLYAHKRLVLIAETQGAYLNRPGMDMINPLTTWFSKDAGKFWSQVDPEVYEGPRADFYLRATELLREAGVPLLMGSDSGVFGVIPGASVARELQLLVAAGLSPYEALHSATRVNAEVLGFHNTGMILPGYRANLVLIPNDPLMDVAAVEFPVGVMIGGYWLDKQALENMKATARRSKITTFFRSLIRVIEMKLVT